MLILNHLSGAFPSKDRFVDADKVIVWVVSRAFTGLNGLLDGIFKLSPFCIS